ncbi:MAG: hypothetical protein KF764_25520 [Labilithrix sp.]|nr:hypothetical protein [Labilithrix sp.]
MLGLACYPLRLRTSHPLPRGFLPKANKATAEQWLRPDEEAKLVSSPSVPLSRRILWGFLAREGDEAHVDAPEPTARVFVDERGEELTTERGFAQVFRATSKPQAWTAWSCLRSRRRGTRFERTISARRSRR